jgi:replicative DNA helicase
MENTEEKELRNITNEILVVGSFYKQPDLSVSYNGFMRPTYDFDDEATRFYYETFDLMYKTFSQSMDEVKINAFMAQNDVRFNTYKKYGSYKTIQDWMKLADSEDFKNYFETLKKYSLVREYHRKGYNVQKILAHKKFPEWKAIDIYKLMRSKVDKISTVILANQDSVILNEGATKDIFSYLVKPQAGLAYPWYIINEIFRGCRLGKAVLNGFLSNEGKTRNIVMLFAYIALVKNQPVLIMSNEMSEEDLKSCLITTVINNQCFRDLHKIDIVKPEIEIVLGRYRDSNGNFIERKIDDDGNFIESEDEFTVRVYQESEEFKKVVEIGKWIEERKEKLIFFRDVGDDYSDERLEFEIRKHNLVYGIKYFAYDTMKGYRTDDWMTVKQTFTKLKELVKETNVFLWSVFQLTDESVHLDIFDFSSNQIANAKQIKHPVDYMLLGKRLNQEEYHKYQYLNLNTWGEPLVCYLNPNKKYFAMKVEKNRSGNKSYFPLFEFDLDLNVWDCIGALQRK